MYFHSVVRIDRYSQGDVVQLLITEMGASSHDTFKNLLFHPSRNINVCLMMTIWYIGLLHGPKGT